jgi:putative redox protein
MKNITRMLSDEVYEGTNENGNKVLIDMRKVEERKGQSPTELLLSALAGCAGVDIVVMLKKRKKTIKEFIIETDGNRKTEAPKFFTDIHCKYIITSPDVNEDELQKAAQLTLEKYCSVATSLKAKITFSVQVINN